MSSDYMEALRRLLNLGKQLLTDSALNINREQRAVLLGAVAQAVPVFVAPWVESAVHEAALTLPDDVTLNLPDLPCPYGFVPLSGDVAHAGGPFGEVRLTGLLWRPFLGLKSQGGEQLCIASCWSDGERSDIADFGLDPIAWGTPLGDLGDLPEQAFRAQDIDTDAMPENWRGGMVEIRKVAYALWAFMRERRVTSVTRLPFTGPVAVRARQAGWTHEPIVQVVELRASEPRPHDADGEHASVDWACRWAVRGHWRKQFYPSDGSHRARWIPAYIKGPEGKPLRAATKLLAVVR